MWPVLRFMLGQHSLVRDMLCQQLLNISRWTSMEDYRHAARMLDKLKACWANALHDMVHQVPAV